MEKCPFCDSENIYFSKKKKIYVCEDCDETFTDLLSSDADSLVNENGVLDLFFSYGHDKNRVLVERIKRDMEKRGHHVWIDTSEIKAGDNWRDDILNGVLKSSSVIAFLSEHSTRNPGVCLDELKIAVCVKGANVKTVLLEPENRIQPPATLSDVQWLDMSEWDNLKKESEEKYEKWYSEKFNELCKIIESKESIELLGDISFLKKKLNPYLNTDKEYTLLSKEYYGRQWLEEYIENWQDKQSAKSLVLYGRPGSGKSAFTVNYSHYNSDVYGCFLCEWNREYTINPKYLIRTIAFRLATKLPDYRRMLIRQLDADVCLDDMSSELLFDFLLTHPLSYLVDGGRGTGIILVDGLDEAEKNGKNPLAEVFSQCVEKLPRWIRFIFTSRPERNVTKYFQESESLDLIKDMPNGYNDILAYLVNSLESELRTIPNKLELLNKICELSDGVFLYAEMITSDIKNGFVKINDIETMPKGLNAFYRMSMERKFSSAEEFNCVKGILELLTISETIPEELIREANCYNQYNFITNLDRIGSWINRYEEEGLYLLGFSHKSLKDWFTNIEQSGDYYVDYKCGASKLSKYCREYIENGLDKNKKQYSDYIKDHIGGYYIAAEQFTELEDFLCANKEEPDPYWRVWDQFPSFWDNEKLLDSFWGSHARNGFITKLQREGNVKFLLWIFDIAEKKYGIKNFDKHLVSVYMDIVHMSGEYVKAVDIADQYLNSNCTDILQDEFTAMLSVRRIHHSMFYVPTTQLLEKAMELYSEIDERFPIVYNELLFLIGGNLGVLKGDWEFCKEWLDKSVIFAEKKGLSDFNKRNCRKLADYYCHLQDYDEAKELLSRNITSTDRIMGRYEAYLMGALANIYTCEGDDDEAMKCYDKLLKYVTAKGISGWVAHANLGIANINYKLGNISEALIFAERARVIYNRIHQEWGIIMSEAILDASKSRKDGGNAEISCENSINRAKMMQYGSCVEAIEEFCSGKNNFLKLYFL